MDKEQFLAFGEEALTYVVRFLENIRDIPLLSSVKPGYMRALVPGEAPDTGDSWGTVLGDIDRVIVSGSTNKAHPHYFAFFPSKTSYPSIVGSMLTDALQMMPNLWESSPAGTELEVVMMDWLGKMLHLPPQFLTDSGGSGGGVLTSSGSESTLIAMLSARAWTIRRHKSSHPDAEDLKIVSKMVAYCSDEAHSSLEKAGVISIIRLRKVASDKKFSLRGSTLQRAIQEDKTKGLIPMFVCATLGTTGPCSFDNLSEIGPVCEAEDVWLHVDAAYAGSYFICPEFRPFLNGVEFARTFYFNPHKAMHVGIGCSALWVSQRSLISDAFQVVNTYMNPEQADRGDMPDYRDWQFDLSRQCRALKVWLVLRLHGVKKLQELARRDVLLAKEFEALIRPDPRFEIVSEVILGVVCFRLKMCNDTNKALLAAINKGGKIFLGPTLSKGIFYLRLVKKTVDTNSDDIAFAWRTIKEVTDEFLKSKQ